MEGVELKEEWQDEDFPRYCLNHAYIMLHSFASHVWVFQSPINRDSAECIIIFCMNLRPLPEEEELEDELFAEASEAGNSGNENTILFFALLQSKTEH